MDLVYNDLREKNLSLLKTVSRLLDEKKALIARCDALEHRAVIAENMAREYGEMLSDEGGSCECLKGIVDGLRK